MAADDLVRMANQIARFFEPYPDEEAVAGVADHLKKFWDPRMRTEISTMSEPLREQLHPLARRAVDRLRTEAVP